MLKKISSYTFVLIGLILLNSCKKEYESAQNIDDAKIADYISKNNITDAVKDPSGYYYQILSQGTGEFYLNTDSVLYNGSLKSLLNGTTYYSSPTSSNMGTYVGYSGQFQGIKIPGILTVLGKLKPGGSARMILPSYLAFGKNGEDAINVPSNEIIDFNITTYPEKKQSELDDRLIKEFMTAKGITNAVKDPSGIYYITTDAGSGAGEIDFETTFKAKYTGRYLNGTTFDSSTDGTASFNLKSAAGSTIEGWQIMVPKLKQGGKMRMIIPSALAYSTTGFQGVPPNSILDFDLEIVEVIN